MLRHVADSDHLGVPVRRVAGCLAVVGVLALMLLPVTPASATPGPPDAPEWWFDSWDVPGLWALGANGHGITIAEVDSGVSGTVPQLSASLLPGTDFGPTGGNGQIDHEISTFGHGTAMASIMVASPGPFGIEGIAPDAKLLPIAVPLLGTDDAQDNDHLADAIRYAADHGANIINLSVGGPRDPSEDPDPCPADEQAAIAYAAAKGAILVASSGNDGTSGDPVEEPGVCVGVVAVGAISSSGQVASFSSRHPYVTVVAPGVDIPSLGRIPGEAFTGEGTSQATAITSAALALIWSKFPTSTNRQILARLLATLDNPHRPADPAYGYGAIDPERAIETDVPVNAAEPVISALAPYIAVQQADALHLTPPAAAVLAPNPPGTFSRAAPPGRLRTPVVLWAGVALAGLIALVALVPLVRSDLRARRRAAWQYDIALPRGNGS